MTAVYEVFRRERAGSAMQPAGSIVAPDERFAEIYAREQYGRRGESDALWLVPREAVNEIVRERNKALLASGVFSIPDVTLLSRKGSLYVTRPTGTHYVGKREALLEGAGKLFAAVQSGAIKVEIGRTFPLSHAADAHRALEGRETTGSVILLP